MRSKDDNQVDSNWKQKYQDADQNNYSAKNKLIIKDFLLSLLYFVKYFQ